MERCLFTILSALSLVICLALGIICICTIANNSHVHLHLDGRPFALAADIGPRGPKLTVRHYLVDDATLQRAGGADTPGQDIEPASNALGFGSAALTRVSDPVRQRWLYTERVLRLPHWSGMLLSGTLPVVWLVLARRRRAHHERRMREGLCLSCGYDLRASKDRCPECGTPVSVRMGNDSRQV